MDSFKELHRRAARRHGGPAALDAELPRPKSKAALRKLGDDRYLAEMTRHVFNAGFVWRVVENKWDGFEAAFAGFDPPKLVRLTEKKLGELAKDTRIVRNPQKIRAVRDNAKLLVELAREHGSASGFFANWPEEDITGLWDLLKRRGSRLGGMTGPMFLRHVGKDTPILTNHVVQALCAQGVIETKSPSSKKALRQIQEAFNRWREESGRSLSEISKVLACTVEG